LTVIASDTSSVSPQKVKSFVVHNGERCKDFKMISLYDSLKIT